MRTSSRPRVVIVGAGFGGLTCARALKRAAVDVLLVDANNYHLFTPLLYQVASSLLDPSQIAQAVRSLIRPLKNCDFRLARVRGADFERKLLRTDAGDLAYDYLVLAAGSESNFFGNAEVEAHAIGLKELPDGLALRNWVLGCFEAAARASSDEERRRLLTFAVVGGGPTGVEYAGALQELTHLVLRKDYPRLDLSLARIVLIEGTGSLLGAFDPRLREAAARSLKRKDVEVWFDAMVATADQDGVALKDGRRLDARTVVWTAGVKASDLGAALGLPLSKGGRIRVDGLLNPAGHPEVFVIGDLAAYEQDGEPLPMLIPVAMQEARRVAATIADMVHNGGATAFRYRDPGIMATIGRNSAVAELGPVHLSGFLGWLMWLFVHLVNVVSFRSRIVVLVNWAWEYVLFDRPVRLIVRAGDDRRG
ncbi:MAG: NAD(P)/FAD-dependent oxidoreductase [Chloroflexi bacterium]|nr:MAG: NAD(P)/FAD-dependent oxidoreductase [Chloroflexota bacterium]